MCGICGLIKYNKNIDSQEIQKMIKILKHRGPDDRGIFIDNQKNQSIGLGHVRLSIIDLSERGHQPMGLKIRSGYESDLIYKDNELNKADYIIVYNGEIYNFIELRTKLIELGYNFESGSDTEVLLKAYVEFQENVLEKINGMFAFVVYDKVKNIIFGARDRIGKKPLKYYWDDNTFIFSSELKAILKNSVKREIDYNGINNYLTLGYIPSPDTGFKNIYKLPHSHYLIFDIKRRKLEIKKYWDLDYSKEKKLKLSKKRIIGLIEKKFEESVKKRLIADVDVGAFLSGGVDSSAVVAFASKYKKKINTFTIKFDESDFDESNYAKIISDKYKTNHHEFLVKPNDMLDIIDKLVYQYEEPYSDPSALPTYILAQKTSKYIKVVLNGDGGDENYAGYDKYNRHLFSIFLKWFPFNKLLSKIFFKLSERTKSLFFYKLYLFFKNLKESYYKKHINFTHNFDEDFKNELFKEEIKNKINNNIYKDLKLINNFKTDYMDKIFYMDFNNYLPDDLMVKVDIATMAHGLESRSPLLDYEFIELNAKLPFKLKIDLFSRKKIFKEMLKKYLDKDILYRSKRGFSVPIKHWFRNELKEYIHKNLLDKNSLVMKLFKFEGIKKIIHDHLKGKDNSNKLWILLMLNKWGEIYFYCK